MARIKMKAHIRVLQRRLLGTWPRLNKAHWLKPAGERVFPRIAVTAKGKDAESVYDMKSLQVDMAIVWTIV